MNVTITPGHLLHGEITAPPSKAHTHRALFAGLLSEGVTEIENPLSCDDTQATAKAVSALGARVEQDLGSWRLQGNGRPAAPECEIQCGESGVTLRFTVPIAALTGSRVTFRGREGLMRRPLEPLAEAMNQLGVRVAVGQDKVRVEGGPPRGGDVRIPGDVSSQFISGLLLAGPLMENGLRIELTSPLESRDYVSLTAEIMKRHGTKVKYDSEMSRFEIAPKQKYNSTVHQIPGDYSSSAFIMSAAAITKSKVLIRGLSSANSEPDAVIVEMLSRMGAKVNFSDGYLSIEGGGLKAATFDIRGCPDLGPIIAVLGCYAEGRTQITGAGRLRYNESDRLSAIASELSALGADVTVNDDGLTVSGPTSLNGGVIDPHGDHRIAMAMSVAALGAHEKVIIKDAKCVNKSYPNFFDDLGSLGVEVVE